MAISVKLYPFAKKINSTAQPSDALAVTATCDIKTPTSITAPTFRFKMPIVGTSQNPTQWNMIYCEDFGGRFYTVNDWRWINGIWEADCKVDALATYKTAIGNSSQYVLRSSYMFNGDVVDTLYPIKGGYTNSVATPTNGATWVDSYLKGSFVIGVISKGSSGVGAATYYALTNANFKALCNALLSTTDWLSIDDISAELQKALINPLQYIVSCKWFPIDLSKVGSTVSSINLGWWNFTVNANMLSGSTVGWTYSNYINIPKHPLIATRGNYLTTTPFTRYELMAYPFGIIPLDGNDLSDDTAITITTNVDFISGQGFLTVDAQPATTGVIYATASAQIGVDMPLAQLTTDVMGVARGFSSAAVNGVASALTGNIGGAIVNAVSGIASASESMFPSLRVMDGDGGVTLFNTYRTYRLNTRFATPVNDDNSHLGRPLCQTKKISDLSGYVLCGSAEVAITGTEAERREIEEFLNTGFFYE